MFVNVVFKIKRYHPQKSELQICINKNKHSFDYLKNFFEQNMTKNK